MTPTPHDTLDERLDEAIPCDYGGCTEDAPCANHLAYRTLPKPVTQALKLLISEAQLNEVERASFTITNTVLTTGDKLSDVFDMYIKLRQIQLKAQLKNETKGGQII